MRKQLHVGGATGPESQCLWFFLLRARDVTVSLPAGILVLEMVNVKSWKILTERHWFGVVCMCSGWDNTQDACWEAHGLTTEMDNDSSLSGLSLCKTAWQSTVLTAPWRHANTVSLNGGGGGAGGYLASTALDYGVLLKLHDLQVWVWAGALMKHTQRRVGGGIPLTLTFFCRLQQWSTRCAHSPPGLVW